MGLGRLGGTARPGTRRRDRGRGSCRRTGDPLRAGSGRGPHRCDGPAHGWGGRCGEPPTGPDTPTGPGPGKGPDNSTATGPDGGSGKGTDTSTGRGRARADGRGGRRDGGGRPGVTGSAGSVATGSGRFGRPGRPLRRSSFLVGFTGALGVLLAYTVFLGIRNAGGILVLVVIALFLAVGLNPAVVRLRRWGLPHGLAVTVVVLTLVLLIIAGLVALVPPVVTQTGQFIEQLPSYVEELRRNQHRQRPGGAVRRDAAGAGAGERGHRRSGARRGARRRPVDLRHDLPGADRAGADDLLPGLLRQAARPRLRAGAAVPPATGQPDRRRDPDQGRRVHGGRAEHRRAGRRRPPSSSRWSSGCRTRSRWPWWWR